MSWAERTLPQPSRNVGWWFGSYCIASLTVINWQLAPVRAHFLMVHTYCTNVLIKSRCQGEATSETYALRDKMMDLLGAPQQKREESLRWACAQLPKHTARAHFPRVRRALRMREAHLREEPWERGTRHQKWASLWSPQIKVKHHTCSLSCRLGPLRSLLYFLSCSKGF